jgi:hypothetical protein
MSTSTPTSATPPLGVEVIDLVDDGDDSKSVTSVNKKRRGRPKRDDSIAAAGEGQSVALVLDQLDVNTPASRYLQEIGPLRMSFVEEFAAPTHHSFSSQSEHVTLNSRDLYQEFVEYQLNLPVAPPSSILVRVQESRLDLVRVLITGKPTIC